MNAKIVLPCLAILALPVPAPAEEPVGERPYEMVWAGRTEDTRPPLVDFEDLDGWTVECADAEAAFARSRRQQLWGKYVGTLTYRGTGPGATVTVKPPKPVPVQPPFDCVNFWVYGNNWAWVSDKTTPQVDVRVLLRGAGGELVRVSLGRVRWREWWVMHRRLSPDQLALLQDGAALEAIEVAGGRNEEDRLLHFDNLAVYQENLPPLEFEPRPQRGIDLPEGQTTGTNTGPGRLPFPNREETILPDNLTEKFKITLEESDGEYVFHYRGDDGHLEYRYKPATSTLGDVTAEWEGRGGPFQPMADGGVSPLGIRERTEEGVEHGSTEAQLLECRREGDVVVARWRLARGKATDELTYRLRLWQKSLVIDVADPSGRVEDVRFGRAVGVREPRLVTLPYLACESQRPAVLVMGPAEQPLFLMGLVDYYRSNASELWAVNAISEEGATYNGGSRYLPKTDGRRNGCFERLFLTVSPRFEEVLPNVANSPSPWMHVAGERLWRAHGASNRERDYATWKEVARYGMTKVVITDHETGWRDGGESFTLRTRAAPGKGGDEGQAEYARKIRALGFRYGIYNNYTDYAPVNEHWDEDYVSRLSDGDWRSAWARCYNPKPARAVELEARLAPIIQEKFHLDTAYCDVHTAVRPWSYCDFDARVPGAGTFAATLYAYGEIMLHQKKTWNGPVYSEGNNHWYYCGLTDGNYGQDQLAHLDVSPWLVDFDLRKLHPLCCNFGMGNLGMFYGRNQGAGDTPEERDARLDRFLAATLAFGHTGFLVMEGGMASAVRSYFNVQQVHARYAQETAADIRYADEKGNLLDTSAAVATGAYRRSQIATTYSNGMKVVVNGHPTETWKTPEAELPPNGWYAEDTRDGKLIARSAIVEGHRADYVDSPAYVYADGRGRFTRFDKAACDGQLVAHKRADGSVELIPVGKCSTLAVSLEGRAARAIALDKEANEMGPAETRVSRGLVYVTPVPDAFSYLVKPQAPPEVSLKCERVAVVPGETVRVTGRTEHEFRVPPEAKPGEQLWQGFDGAWIDFTVLPLVSAKLRVVGCVLARTPVAGSDKHVRASTHPTGLILDLTPHLPSAAEAEVTLDGQTQRVKLVPETTIQLEFPFRKPTTEEVREVPLKVAAGDLVHEQAWWLKAEESIQPLAALSDQMEAGERLRGGPEKSLGDPTRSQVLWTERSCGGENRKCLFMHPPYIGGVGYAFARFEPVELPQEPNAALRCDVGKADGSDPGDGILFRVAVVDADGTETVVAEKQWIEHAWTPLEADLSRWAGRQVRIKLTSDVGPGDNSSGDWACWTGMRIETFKPALGITVHDQPVELPRQPGPFPLQGLTVDDLRAAKRGLLHYQGIGLQCGGQYVSDAILNRVPLGPIPGAGGREGEGVWSEAAMELAAEAIAALDEWNRLKIENPGRDSFKIGRFWIEIELADGRKASSQVTATVYTQPPEWPHAEGTLVPFEEPIEPPIRFRLVADPQED
ncbi:MAG TPA: hypothetical protein VMY37_13560 [Thermoguttaceae bacterium]|nr:hypothetical protein [Thermoguttaceae bacterium]